MELEARPRWHRRFGHRLAVTSGAAVLSLGCFLVLPLLQAISQTANPDLTLTGIDTASLPPPPPAPEVESEPPPPPPQEQPAAPELAESAEPLDLSQLEMALNPSLGEGWGSGDFAVKLSALPGATENATEEVDALFSLADLDQKPRVLHQPGPVWNAELRKKAPATVYVLFVVGPDGKVADPVVQSSTDPTFERSALAAVKQWKFEPGKRNGQPVRFRMRVPITFPQGG